MKRLCITAAVIILINFSLLAQSANIYKMNIKRSINGTVDTVKVYTDDITEIKFVPSPCKDIVTVSYSGLTYHTVAIGTQCWLKENLNIGTRVAGTATQTNNSILEKYCYNDQENNCTTYGGLYQWDEAMQYVTTAGAQGICPSGWHIPTTAEYETLVTAVDGDHLKLLAVGQSQDATNSSGFTALLAGFRNVPAVNGWPGTFIGLLGGADPETDMWSSSQGASGKASYFFLYTYSVNNFDYIEKAFGFSIRCIKN